MGDPFKDLLEALEGLSGTSGLAEDVVVRPDANRLRRKGVPEIILAAGKRPEDVIRAARAILDCDGRAIISRTWPELNQQLSTDLSDYVVDVNALARMVVVRRQGFQGLKTGGRVGLLTAGTSDVPAAEEAAIVAREMGCEVLMAHDVGVAGIHRLLGPLRALADWGVDAVVVAAGMDGALPSVVAGLIDVPVIGLPTSNGYGVGGNGLAALLSMLQTCSPGLAVVNVDNGVGAGAMAAMIANRAALARKGAEAGWNVGDSGAKR